MLPQHPHLKLIANSEQHLTGQTLRRLLTYEKHSEPLATTENMVLTDGPLVDFRERYFDSNIETRSERRTKQALLREKGREEALKRGKIVGDSKLAKCNLNKARFLK